MGICQSFLSYPEVLSVLSAASVHVSIMVMNSSDMGQRSIISGLCQPSPCHLPPKMNPFCQETHLV